MANGYLTGCFKDKNKCIQTLCSTFYNRFKLISKYILEIKSWVSHSQRKKLQIRKEWVLERDTELEMKVLKWTHDVFNIYKY